MFRQPSCPGMRWAFCSFRLLCSDLEVVGSCTVEVLRLPVGNEGKVAFCPAEWKGVSSRISSEIRQRATFFAREGVRGGNRGVAYIPRLEVVGAIEVEQLRPVGFPFDQDRFSTDEGLGGDFRREGKEVAAMGRNHRGEGEAHQSDAPFGHCKGLFLFRAFQGYSGSLKRCETHMPQTSVPSV